MLEYEDGHTFCHHPDCGEWKASAGALRASVPSHKVRALSMKGTLQGIKDRRVSLETCKKFGVTVEMAPDGKIASHYYPHYHTESGELVASKKRICEQKSFSWSGDREHIGLFGQKACRGNGKYITITEGEVDALSVSEMFDNKWDVVSLVDGAQSAERDIKRSLEWLEGYEHVVLCLDNDTEGLKAVDKVKDLFSPNKVKVVSLPRKDANAMLTNGEVSKFVKAWWGAKAYRPDGLVMVSDTWDAVLAYRDTPSIPYPWSGLNDKLLGQRTKEIVVWAAETGIGKSQTMREIQDHIVQTTDERVGGIMLEESVAKTTLGFMSMAAGRPLHKELATLSDEELRRHWEIASDGNRIVLLDHNGWQNNMDTLKARIRYMRRALGCTRIVLDHLHMALSSIAGATGDWSGIDELMTEFVSMVHELDITLHLVCHTSAERSLRGSKGISKLVDAIIFLERDKHAEGELADITEVIVDKNRFAGDIGLACKLKYDRETGRMTELPPGYVVDGDISDEF